MSVAAPRPAEPAARLLVTQASIVRALVLRELITRYGRDNIGFLWFVLEPAMFTTAIVTLWSLVPMHSLPGLSIAAFAVTGYSSVLLWRNCASRCARAAHINWALLYHRQVTPLDIYLSRALLEIGAGSLSFVLLSTFFVALGWMPPPEDIAAVAFAWLQLALFALSFGLLVGAASDLNEIVDRVWHVLAYVLFPLSGAVSMANWLPASLRRLDLLLPMVHGVELLRGGWFGSLTPTYGSPAYLAASTVVFGTAALFLMRLRGREAAPE